MHQGGISLQAMAIDCLSSCKHFCLEDSFNTLESSNAQVRQMFQQMAQQHQSMAEDWFQLMNSRGWYQVPDVRPEVRNQVSSFINSLRASMNVGMAAGNVQQYGQGQFGYGQQTYGDGRQSIAEQSQPEQSGQMQETQNQQQYLT